MDYTFGLSVRHRDKSLQQITSLLYHSYLRINENQAHSIKGYGNGQGWGVEGAEVNYALTFWQGREGLFIHFTTVNV